MSKRRPCTECGRICNGQLCLPCLNRQRGLWEDLSPDVLRGGQWVPNGRGIVVWREDGAA